MYEAILISSVLFFALGYFVGKMRAETKQMETDIAEIEKLSSKYRPVLRAANDQIDRINATGMQ